MSPGDALLVSVAATASVTATLLGDADAGDIVSFSVAAAALIPLAWLIGHATDQAAEHTGPGVAGFLNASFGNAPEVIISVFAIANGLPGVVRGSLVGSVVGNALLVLGFVFIFGPERNLDRASLVPKLALVAAAALTFLWPAARSWHGDPERRSLALASLPLAAVLIAVYIGTTAIGLRRYHRVHRESVAPPAPDCWPLGYALAILALATVATTTVSATLVHAITGFARSLGINSFGVSAVIVAIAGNAAEHGGAVLVARRGRMALASELPLSSSVQVAVFVIPAMVILSWGLGKPLPLSFGPIEIAAMVGAATVGMVVIGRGRSSRMGGAVLLLAYAVVVVAFFTVGGG